MIKKKIFFSVVFPEVVLRPKQRTEGGFSGHLCLNRPVRTSPPALAHMEEALRGVCLAQSDDEIDCLERLMDDLKSAAALGTGATKGDGGDEEESLDYLIAKYLCVDDPAPPPSSHAQEERKRNEENENEDEDEDEDRPGHYWVGRTTPYYAEEAVAGHGDPLGAVVAGSHVRVVDVHADQRWVVEIPPPHGASYARLRVACLASDVHASGWRRLS
jgi:hypothetical protein